MAMLQALTYKNKESVLVSEEIAEITRNLSEYGFGGIKSDDILNCCYTYIGHNFYENKVLEFLKKADMAKVFTPLKKDILNRIEVFLVIIAAEILHKLQNFPSLAYVAHSCTSFHQLLIGMIVK